MAKKFSELNPTKKNKVIALLAPALGYVVPPPPFQAEETPEQFVVRYYDELPVRDYRHALAEKKAAEEKAKVLSEEDV